MNYKPFSIEQAKAGKPVITRDGRPARIVCWDRKSKYPLFGFVGKMDEHTCSWDEKGKTYDTHTTNFDLLMAPEEKTVWVNMYIDGRCYWYETEKVARISADDGGNYIGTFPITYQE